MTRYYTRKKLHKYCNFKKHTARFITGPFSFSDLSGKDVDTLNEIIIDDCVEDGELFHGIYKKFHHCDKKGGVFMEVFVSDTRDWEHENKLTPEKAFFKQLANRGITNGRHD